MPESQFDAAAILHCAQRCFPYRPAHTARTCARARVRKIAGIDRGHAQASADYGADLSVFDRALLKRDDSAVSVGVYGLYEDCLTNGIYVEMDG